MKTEISDATQIRELVEKWATSTRDGDDDEVLSNHATDILIFDVLSPLQYKGADAYRKSWDEWQPSLGNGTRFEIHDLDITAGDDVAFGHCLIECGNTLPNGEKNEDWVRATFCLRKMNSQWIVTHQHISMPIERKGDNS
ncbi:MAG: nuclear transport factor 2 family protein [Ferruginibacter sp.]|nr:nuclear transport factor 2 family protein [Cytophagales bacterium]